MAGDEKLAATMSAVSENNREGQARKILSSLTVRLPVLNVFCHIFWDANLVFDRSLHLN